MTVQDHRHTWASAIVRAGRSLRITHRDSTKALCQCPCTARSLEHFSTHTRASEHFPLPVFPSYADAHSHGPSIVKIFRPHPQTSRSEEAQKLWLGKCEFMYDRQSIYLHIIPHSPLFGGKFPARFFPYLWSTFFRCCLSSASPSLSFLFFSALLSLGECGMNEREAKFIRAPQEEYEYGAHLIRRG